MSIDIISLIVESVLAILALAIAAIQFIGEVRAHKEEEKEKAKLLQEKNLIEMIVSYMTEAQNTVDYMRGFRQSIEERMCRNDNNPDDTFKFFNDSVNEYEEKFKHAEETVLRPIYIWLLKNEDKFPMAHGYGRYIEDLRTILNFEDVKRAKFLNGYDNLIVASYRILQNCYKKGGKISEEEGAQLGQLFFELQKTIVPYYKHADLIAAVIDELSIKYNPQYLKDGASEAL